jgi:flagella basal body P-ring formation protein FlgA
MRRFMPVNQHPINQEFNQQNRAWIKCQPLTVSLLLAGALYGLSISASAETADAKPMKTEMVTAKQNLADVKAQANAFLKMQTIGYPGEVTVNIGSIDPNLRLAACNEMQFFLPNGSRAWGKTTVGVQCQAPSKWSMYIQSSVKVVGNYLVAAAPLGQGQVLSDRDVIYEKGDLTQLPAGVFTEQSQALGRSVQISITAGTVLRQEMLKVIPAIQQGQVVKVVSTGEGFSVSAEGLALGKANEGQVVQAKVASGKVVTGIARLNGQVEVAF